MNQEINSLAKVNSKNLGEFKSNGKCNALVYLRSNSSHSFQTRLRKGERLRMRWPVPAVCSRGPVKHSDQFHSFRRHNQGSFD